MAISGTHAHASSSGMTGHALTARLRRRAVVMFTGRSANADDTVARVSPERRANSVTVSPRTRTACAKRGPNTNRVITTIHWQREWSPAGRA